MNKNGDTVSVITKKSIIRQRPRLLYAGTNTNGEGWLDTPHSHEYPELLLIGAGTGKIRVGENDYPFKAGDLIVLNKDVTHSVYFAAEAPRELLFWALDNLQLSGMDKGAILRDKPFALIPTEEYFVPLSGLVRTMIAESEGRQPFHDLMTDHLVRAVLLYVLRIAACDVSLTFKQNSAYIEAKEYFDAHFVEIHNLDNVCKSLYINKYYLSHVFKEQTGIPPIKYLIQKRIELACRHLETSDRNVGDVARACGYVDTGYFCRVFKSVKGVSPLRYRYNYKQAKALQEKQKGP